MTAYRPDLLPFALPTRLGLPYHGTVKNDLLTLPDSSQIPYPAPDSGAAILVEHQLAEAPTLSAEESAVEAAKGYQWLPYAYLSGTNRDIGGHALGKDTWLYCDGTNTWIVKVELAADSIFVPGTVTVYITGRFGHFSDTDSETFITRTAGVHVPTRVSAAQATYHPLFHNKTGSLSILNMMVYSSAIFEDSLAAGRKSFSGGSGYDLYECVKITLSGIGSTEEGQEGTGITAAFDVIKTDQDHLISYTTYTTGAANPTPGQTCTYSSPYESAGFTEYYWYIMSFCDSSGTVKHVTVKKTTETNTVSTVVCTEFAMDPSCDAYGQAEYINIATNSVTITTKQVCVGDYCKTFVAVLTANTEKTRNWYIVDYNEEGCPYRFDYDDSYIRYDDVISGDGWVFYPPSTVPLYAQYIRITDDMYFEIKTTSQDTEHVTIVSPEGAHYDDTGFGSWTYDIKQGSWARDDTMVGTV